MLPYATVTEYRLLPYCPFWLGQGYLILFLCTLHSICVSVSQVHKGVRGVVKDKSGKPIVGAMIVLNGGVRVFTAEGGYFHALLAPGNHNIEAVADGYQQQRQEVVVSSYEAASSIIIEFDMDNRIFGLPREFVVATAGKHEEKWVLWRCYLLCNVAR